MVDRHSATAWAKHFQRHWAKQAEDQDAPNYLRVAFYCYARHASSGHTLFGAGELARLLARADRQTGEIKDCTNVARAVKDARDKGYIGKWSTVRCLVAPYDVQKNTGDVHAPCPVHTDHNGVIPV